MGRLAGIGLCVLAGCGRPGCDVRPVEQATPGAAGLGDLAPSDGLGAHWAFDDFTSLGTPDTSGNGHDASCAVGQCPASGTGIAASDMMFDGHTSCLTVPTLASWSAAQLTISAWIRSPAMQGPIVVHESSNG